MAYGRNLLGVYTDLPMPKGTQRLLLGPARNGQGKHLALLGIESLEVRWSSSYTSISEVKGYSDWNCNVFFGGFFLLFFFFPLVTLALSGPEEALILVW